MRTCACACHLGGQQQGFAHKQTSRDPGGSLKVSVTLRNTKPTERTNSHSCSRAIRLRSDWRPKEDVRPIQTDTGSLHHSLNRHKRFRQAQIHRQVFTVCDFTSCTARVNVPLKSATRGHYRVCLAVTSWKVIGSLVCREESPFKPSGLVLLIDVTHCSLTEWRRCYCNLPGGSAMRRILNIWTVALNGVDNQA